MTLLYREFPQESFFKLKVLNCFSRVNCGYFRLRSSLCFDNTSDMAQFWDVCRDLEQGRSVNSLRSELGHGRVDRWQRPVPEASSPSAQSCVISANDNHYTVSRPILCRTKGRWPDLRRRLPRQLQPSALSSPCQLHPQLEGYYKLLNSEQELRNRH